MYPSRMFSIDRERFLVLTAALAASVPACATTPATAPPVAEPLVIPPIASAPPRAASAGASASAMPPREVPPPDEPPQAPTAGSPDPYAGTPVHAQACPVAENAIGQIPACALKAPGPTCESFSDTKTECPPLTRLLKPRVAAAAIACLNGRSGTQAICEFNVSSICAYEALGSACLDPSAAAACTKVMARCGTGTKMSRSSCEAGVSAIADGKRARFLSCISESCAFESCLTYL